MKEQKQTQTGFTLIEMLVVIAIIALLVSLVFPGVNRALQRARQTKCLSHLRNFGTAWNTYYLDVMSGPFSEEMDAVFPWLSSMYPDYISDKSMYVCPSDQSNGLWGSKPAGPDESEVYRQQDTNDFPETDDNVNNPASGQWSERNPEIEYNSYMYEFNDADVPSWPVGYVYKNSSGGLYSSSDLPTSWGRVKMHQLQHGDTFNNNRPYDRAQFPLARCFHHYGDREVMVRDTFNNTTFRSFRVTNVAVSGNVSVSGLQWEFPLAE